MGRYINWDDIVLKYPVAASRGGATEIGSTYIGYIEAEVDGKFSGFFTVPFSNNNITVRDICTDLAYSRIGNFKLKDREVFQKAIADRIEGIKMGSESMINEDGTALNSVGGTIYSNTQDYHPVFGMGDTLSFVVDSSQVSAEEDDRV